MNHKYNNSDGRFIYLERGPEQHEVQAEKAETPLEKAKEKFKFSLSRVGFQIVKKYEELFKNGKTQKAADEFSKASEAMIRNMNELMNPGERTLLKDSGEYKTPTDFVNPFKVAENTTMHIRVTINDKADIEAAISRQ